MSLVSNAELHPRTNRSTMPVVSGLSDIRSQLDVSVVMPCLNEEEGVGICVAEALRAIEDMGALGEVIVVDNGSTDRSAEIALAAGARVIHEPNRGYGNACRRGLGAARGRFLILGDADGTYDFSAIPQFVAPLYNGADMVMGSRLQGVIEDGAMPWLHRHVGNPFLTRMMNYLFKNTVSDAHCGLRSIKHDHYRRLSLNSSGMEFASELIIEATRFGVRIEETPIRYRARTGGDPKLRTFRDGWRHLRLMLMLAFEAWLGPGNGETLIGTMEELHPLGEQRLLAE